MKKLIIASLLSVTLSCVVTAQTNKAIPSAEQESLSPVPSLGLEEAVRIAKSHLQEKKIGTSKHYLDNVRLLHSSTWMKGKHWIVTWKLNVFADGGEIIVFVGMDKKTRMTYGE
jgi:hypothetical protein